MLDSTCLASHTEVELIKAQPKVHTREPQTGKERETKLFETLNLAGASSP